MAYVESFDLVTLTETFIDKNFDLSRLYGICQIRVSGC